MAGNADDEARIFAVETRFQTLARRDGGMSRDRAIARAQARIEEARPAFDEWLDAEVKDFSGLIKAAQAGTGRADWVGAANLRGRALRDSATTLGFELIAFIAGSLCEILDAIEAGAPCNMDSITCHVDALALARQMAYRDVKPEQVPQLTKGLRRVVKQVTG